MKRLLSCFCMVFLLLLPVSGCGKMLPVTADFKGNGTPLSELSGPPTLTVLVKGQKIRAVCVGSEWTSNGETVDGAGRFLFDYYLNGLIEWASADSRPVTLRFDAMPDRILSLRAWDLAVITEEYEYSQEDDAIEIDVSGNRFVLPEGGVYLYELSAEWEERDGVGGDATYAFILSDRLDKAK